MGLARGEYTGLELKAIRDDAEGVYLFGVELDGAFFAIGAHKIGDVDERVQHATDAAEAARAAAEATAARDQTFELAAGETPPPLPGDPGPPAPPPPADPPPAQ